jgi:hypothetical protein
MRPKACCQLKCVQPGVLQATMVGLHLRCLPATKVGYSLGCLLPETLVTTL